MPNPSPGERAAFGRRLRQLCDDNKPAWSAPALARHLTELRPVDDYSVTGANVRHWWAGENAPREREVVAALDALLGSGDELQALLGMNPRNSGPTAAKKDRVMDDLEARLALVEARINRILAQLEAD